MDRGADLVITRSTQPRLQLNQQRRPHLLLLKKSCLLKIKSPQAATVALVQPPPQLLSLALTGLPCVIISRFLCLLLVKNVLPEKMLMLIYRLFSMVFLKERDCRHLLNFLRSRCAIFPSLSSCHRLPIRVDNSRSSTIITKTIYCQIISRI